MGTTRGRRITRDVIGIVATFVLTTSGVGLLTIDSFGYWGNAITEGVGFILGAYLAARVARADALTVVAIGLALSWGTIAIFVLATSVQKGGVIRSPGVVLAWVLVSLLVAHRVGVRYRSRFAGLEPPGDPAPESAIP